MTSLSVRDKLAVERTILANERTFLSYLRTSLTMAALGVTALKFLNNIFFVFAGWLTIGASAVILLIGLKLFTLKKRAIGPAALLDQGGGGDKKLISLAAKNRV